MALKHHDVTSLVDSRGADKAALISCPPDFTLIASIGAKPMSSSFQIAERSTVTPNSFLLLRFALVVIFIWFGGMKFTQYEANGIAPFVANSPLMSWLHALFGVQGASYVIGVIELLTATALALGPFSAPLSVVGAAMSSLTYIITLTFLFTTPGVSEPTAGGFPAISAPIGQFLLKDAVLLAASLCLLRASLHSSNR
jgi:uncharacterized membrane protein YkgB